MSRLPWILLGAGWLLLAQFVPAFWISLANIIGISAIVALGLVVLTGVGGMTSFGQASFMGFGAYTTAILTTSFGLSPWLTLPLAVAASLAAALVIGAVTLRLSGHYLALATIAWSVSLFYLAGVLDITGRYDGIPTIPAVTLFGLSLADPRRFFVVIWVCVGLAILATHNLLDSRVGRAIRALRGGALAGASCGAPPIRARMLAFLYAAALAGLAGWLYAHLQRAVNPTPFGLPASIQYLLMAVLGGAGQIGGALLGAALVTLVNDRLQTLLPHLIGAQGNFETIVFGVLMVLVLQTAPDGLWPHLGPRLMRLLLRSGAKPVPILPSAAPLTRRDLPASGSPLLGVSGLTRRFGGLVAVNDLTFAMNAGEIVGLIGPNGAGKSTTFNMLTGVDRADAGRIVFRGEDVTGSDAPAIARLGIARSFQHVKLVAEMTVIENAALGAHLRGHAGAQAALLRLDRAEEARLLAEAARQLERVGLLEDAHRPAGSLPLGQQRIVEIARALCLDPVLLLLDEPAAGLRHAEKIQLADLLRRLREQGMSILLVEHDMDFVMGLTDRLVVMDFGEKLAEGTPANIRADPNVIEAYLGSVA